VSGALFAALVVDGVMLIWNWLYRRKLRRQADASARAATNG
jgi:hypothetical protein